MECLQVNLVKHVCKQVKKKASKQNFGLYKHEEASNDRL